MCGLETPPPVLSGSVIFVRAVRTRGMLAGTTEARRPSTSGSTQQLRPGLLTRSLPAERQNELSAGVPNGIRTRVATLKGHYLGQARPGLWLQYPSRDPSSSGISRPCHWRASSRLSGAGANSRPQAQQRPASPESGLGKGLMSGHADGFLGRPCFPCASQSARSSPPGKQTAC
jgi:hypothetical protein